MQPGPNGGPPSGGISVPDLANPKAIKVTPFEAVLLSHIRSITTAIYALTVQLEAGRIQRTSAEPADIEATAKHAQDVATLALKLAGALPLVEKLGAQEAEA